MIDPNEENCEFYENDDGKFNLISTMSKGVFYSKVVDGFFFRVEHLWEMESPTLEALKELKLL